MVRRRTSRADEIQWDPATSSIDAKQLVGVDAVVHLAGASVAGGRWTRHARRKSSTAVFQERVSFVKRSRSDEASTRSRRRFGDRFYGNRGQETLTKTARPVRVFGERDPCLGSRHAART